MKAHLRNSILLLVLFFGSTNAHALPVGWSLYVGGNTRIITTDAGMQWLSPYTSNGISWNDVVAEQNSGPSVFDGYRLAITNEFIDLINSYGIHDTGWTWTDVTDEEDLNQDSFHADFGITQSSVGTNFYTVGTIVYHETGQLIEAVVGSRPGEEKNGYNPTGYEDYSSRSVGHGLWLVKEASAPVPEPNTYILLSSGLIGLVWYRRRSVKA